MDFDKYQDLELTSNSTIIPLWLQVHFWKPNGADEIQDTSAPLDFISVDITYPNKTGVAHVYEDDGIYDYNHGTYWEIIPEGDSRLLKVYLSNLPVGVSRVTIRTRFGKNNETVYVYDLKVPNNIYYLETEDGTILLERRKSDDKGIDPGTRFYCYVYYYGNIKLWIPEKYVKISKINGAFSLKKGDVTVKLIEDIDGSFYNTTEVNGKIVGETDEIGIYSYDGFESEMIVATQYTKD